MPTCDGTLAPDQCVAPLYAPQFDPQNTAGTPGVADEDVFRSETVYSENNALEGSPLNQSFFALVCVATVGFSTLDPTACATTLFGKFCADSWWPDSSQRGFREIFRRLSVSWGPCRGRAGGYYSASYSKLARLLDAQH